MAKTKEQKKQALEEIKDKVDRQKVLMFVEFSGLQVNDMFELRNKLKNSGGELKVAKKTIMGLALKDKGLEFDVDKLEGEIALVFGYEDLVTPAKIVYEFAQENSNLEILGGFLENELETAERFIFLAQTPSQEELLARMAGSLSAPLTNFVRALNYNIKGLVYTLNAIKESK
ncbi:MAG: 50S ribosomal protein L10 [Candidatus Nealsonbacteria bacterium]|nr:50S ribosomal protein L10 [Candidatus Nealsonbacteria bacterium]